MILRNTTSIPDQLIAIAVAHCIQAGVEVNEIVVKNKAAGKVNGQWGWYYPSDKKVVLIVPQEIKAHTHRAKYSKLTIRINSRAEFLIAVMAHELRHAWQWQVDRKNLDGSSLAKFIRERDAERYELGMLMLWQQAHGTVQAQAACRV